MSLLFYILTLIFGAGFPEVAAAWLTGQQEAVIKRPEPMWLPSTARERVWRLRHTGQAHGG